MEVEHGSEHGVSDHDVHRFLLNRCPLSLLDVLVPRPKVVIMVAAGVHVAITDPSHPEAWADVKM